MRRRLPLLIGLLLLGACDPMGGALQRKPPLAAAAAAPEGMVRIPAGPFTMGTDEEDVDGRGAELGLMVPWFDTAHPAHPVDLAAYFIDATEVTNGAYGAFVAATGHQPPPHWQGPAPPQGLETHPVTHVSWHDAESYCNGRGGTLPTEAQWEKAARGTDGRAYPWGSTYTHDAANVARGHTLPVGSVAGGDSPYGVKDLIGNVWEWTADWYQPYPGGTYQDDRFGTTVKVLRGNSWASVGHYPDQRDFMDIVANNSRATYRLFLDPAGRLNDVGFRCVQPTP
ncbi:MAG: SUMF1/EgtB/PvdO family nonheme iron enzyme [Nitrospirae bacterium]|nr:SUMF1/EgtB/PvdO family nonheme iron enzyme [Nitrospirota bacterium]